MSLCFSGGHDRKEIQESFRRGKYCVTVRKYLNSSNKEHILCATVHGGMNTKIPPLLCPWPKHCRRSTACLHGVMLSFKQQVFRTSGEWGTLMDFNSGLNPQLGPFEVVRCHVCTDVWVQSWEAKALVPLWWSWFTPGWEASRSHTFSPNTGDIT